jgi:hypothetical protein
MSLHPLVCYPHRAPRAKFRGQRRYFRKIHRQAASLDLRVEGGSWWNLWHYHADWRGQGNRGWRRRREHLGALAAVFRQIAAKHARFPTPFQAWIMIDGEDAGQDAVFLHTPNPHGTIFPITIPDIEWGTSALEPFFRECLPGLDLRVGHARSRSPDEDGVEQIRTAHLVWARGVGEPIAPG